MSAQMNLSAFASRSQDGSSAMQMNLRAGMRSFSFEHRVATGDISATGDAALAATLLPSMRWGGTLQVDAPVSSRLLANVGAIQKAFLAHSRRLRPLEVVAPVATDPEPASGRGVACFFSGGIDSFYSVLSHRNEISHLIFVHGFDIPLGERSLRARVSASLRDAAAELGKPLIEVESDVRRFSDRYVDWPNEYLGASLASVGLLLGPRFRKVYIASGYAPGVDVFSGSTPEIDPLWSTESTEIAHDGQVARIEKIAAIAESPVALRRLRVCWENRGGAYNCGRCVKCLLAMAGLRAVDALQRCETFPLPLDLDALARLPLTGAYLGVHIRAYLDCADAAGDTELAAALRKTLRRATRRQQTIDRFKEHIRGGLRYRLAALRR